MRSFLNKIDMYKKIPEDLYISSFSGSCMSIVGLLIMTILFILEFNAYLTGTTQSDMVLDEMLRHSDYLSAVFNITVTDMPCVFVSVDVTDVTGTTRQNVTKNIQLLRVNHDGTPLGVQSAHEIEPEEHNEVFDKEDEEFNNLVAALEKGEFSGEGHSEALTQDTFEGFVKAHARPHELVFVDFFAPWCIWCQRLEPVWTKMSQQLGDKGPIYAASVDCTANAALCQSQQVRAYPTMLMFRHGDTHPFEAYHGERTSEALLARATQVAKGDQAEADKEKLKQHKAAGGGKKGPVGGEGCRLTGRLKVKKVPGTIRINLHSLRYSYDTLLINASHHVDRVWFSDPEAKLAGTAFGHWRESIVQRWQTAPLNGKTFIGHHNHYSYVHYIKLVAKSMAMTSTPSDDDLHLHTYSAVSTEHEVAINIPPFIALQYDISPIAVLEYREFTPFYHFMTNFMAIVGGVFAIVGLVENAIFQFTKSKRTL